MSSNPPRRHTHRKRISALRLSSDTTATLPEYIPSTGWHQQYQPSQLHQQQLPESRSGRGGHAEQADLNEDCVPSDKPPDYSDSAEEADEDTDDYDSDQNIVYPQPGQPGHLQSSSSPFPRPRTASPRRSKRFLPPPSHKRRQSSQTHFLHSSKRPSSDRERERESRRGREIDGLPSPSASTTNSTDPFLDSLLERSVHALEMSNTLLQSSISTQTSLSTILNSGPGSPGEETLETSAMNLTSRMQDAWDVRAAWAEDLEEITRDVEGLLGVPSTTSTPAVQSAEREAERSGAVTMKRPSLLSAHSREGSGASGVSSSLPSASPLSSAGGSMKRNGRRPSLDLRQASVDSIVAPAPRLNYAQQYRAALVSPPPRPITQFLPAQLDNTIALPSTLGIRSQPSMHLAPEWKSVSELASSSTTSLLATPQLATTSLPPKLTDKPLEPSTPAYTMLSSFVSRQPQASTSGSNTPSTSFTTSFMSNIRRPRNASTSTERSNGSTSTAAGKRRSTSPSPSPRLDRGSRTPHRGVSPLDLGSHRPMTPPVEESGSSSDSCVAKRTVQSLRKILDDQPPPQIIEPSGIHGSMLKAPKFMPRTPAPLAEAGTSTATASVSKLFTKSKHSSSTRPPSPPALSAMKHSRNNSAAPSTSSVPPTPTTQTLLAPPLTNASSSSSTPSPSPTVLSIPDLVSRVLTGRSSASASSSGRSTPNRRISFAELPESYASTRPGGGSSKFKDKHNRRKRKSSSGHGRSKDGSLTDGGSSPPGWWNGWLGQGGSGGSGLGGLSLSLARQEERMEDRMSRNWGGRMGAGFGSGLDEWAV